MINRLQKSMDEKDKGFTLVELLVVIVIIGILAGIAIPLFLNQRQKGVEAGIKSDLKAAATVQETYFVDEGKYAADLTTLEDAGFTATEENEISVALVDSGDGFCIAGENDGADKSWHYNSLTGGLAEGACA
ncbi:type IV pilin protein [Nocardioides dongxiaopingii]|uniref:type IV pilin protein n=1 Tax=Nocardioides dongxiaopingii TaxID=2576036 RepID=UPI0010C76CED|nr:prepilin-type N-terminal cleavage/methylation domain-containing protein [Nocardioides dongxiaopingii]